MSMAHIQPQFLTLTDLLKNRLFRIPQYQRAYSWETKNRNDMFEDIKKLTEKLDRHHFMATVVGLRRENRQVVTDVYSVVEVVDGQQRLTTLILLLKAISKHLDRKLTANLKLAIEIQELLVKQDDLSLILLQMNHDSSQYFANYLRNGTIISPDKAKNLADQALLNAIHECEAFVTGWGDLIQLTSILKNNLTFIFHEINDEAIVYTVFEVLNSRGLPVPWVDRLKSMLMAIASENDLSNKAETLQELHGIWGSIYTTIGLRQGLSTEALRFAATLKSPKETSKPFGEEDAVEALVRECHKIPRKAVETSNNFLEVVKAVDRFLVSMHRSRAVTRISHARLLAIAIVLRQFPEADEKRLLDLWEKISFRVFGLCRKDARTQVGAYVRLAWQCYNQNISVDQVEKSLTEIGSDEREHSIQWAIEHIRNTNCYENWEEELRYLMYRYEEGRFTHPFPNEHWNHIWELSASHSIEHICPQNTNKPYVHRLGNLLLLPPRLNSSLKDKKPLEKVRVYRDTGLYMATEVASIIEREGWELKQVETREENLLNWIEQTWG